ncbi:MAG: stage 0 sporulation family protein [Anaerolineae bacterium]|nr:stage 0 sporulation family protein [Anaerolineae bacterium]
MPLVVGVAFQPVTKVYYFDPAGHDDLQADERVVVDTARGRTLGQVVFPPREVAPSELTGSLKPVVRRATAWDMVQHDQAAHKETETREICQKRADALRLDMKVVKTEYSFDGGSVVVYFSSEQRIDFRNLVHDLSQALHTRVEMRQVGVRDEAKFLGGYGRCGRPLCCASWLREFAPVSIKMAKSQDLPLNASEVSGVCGRLLCCLSYENDFYTEARQRMPKVNSIIDTPQGPGRIKQLNILKNSVIAVVEGPGESLQYVEVALPEPASAEGAAKGGCAGCAKRRTIVGSGDEAESASAEDAARASARLDDGELSGGTGDAQAQPASGGQGAGARSRSRRKKR